jgi:hypothetical protein
MLLNGISFTMPNFIPPRAGSFASRSASVDSKKRETPNEQPLPIVEVLPMPQILEIRDGKEDWTGKTSAVLRRKLQNRLNQRAARTYPHPALHPSLIHPRPSKATRKRRSLRKHSTHPTSHHSRTTAVFRLLPLPHYTSRNLAGHRAAHEAL